MYNQKIGNGDNLYFYHEIETKFIEDDDKIQLRPLEPKILPRIFHLKQSVQLLPSLGRLDPDSKTIKIIENICFILDQIEEYSIKNKWDPDNPESKSHQLSRT